MVAHACATETVAGKANEADVAEKANDAADLARRIIANDGADGAPTVRELLLHYPDFRRRMVGAAVRCLGAKKAVFDRERKNWIVVDDCTSQMKAVVWLSAYTEGLPMQTNVSLNIGDQKRIAEGDGMTLEAALRSSPALRDRLEAVINASKGQGKALKQAEKAE